MDCKSPCHKLARDLKAAIDARMRGEQVTQIGHRGRNMSFAEVNLNQLISYYNQTRAGCPDALADPELIAIAPVDQPFVTRGRPAVYLGKSTV
jgi:hypothetical protein